MSVVLDTTILIDYLRGREEAAELLEHARTRGTLQGSEITRLEVLVGMRPDEEDRTRLVLSTLHWHPVDTVVAEKAGELGRAWRPSHSGVDAADLVIAATAVLLKARLLTRNVRHFPMFSSLESPY